MPTAPPRGRLSDVHADVLGPHHDHTVVESFTDCSSETCVEDDDGRRHASTYRTAETNNYSKIRGGEDF